MSKAIVIIALCLLSAGAFGQSPRLVEDKLMVHMANLKKWSNYGASYDGDRLEQANGALRRDLIKFGGQAATLSYAFPRLKSEMTITTSRDGRFRIYSWDQQSGGTMHDFDSVFQFKGKSGKVHAWGPRSTIDGDFGAFFHDIFQVQTASGTVYLGVSTFIGSTSLAGQSIRGFLVTGETLDANLRIIRTANGLKNSISFEYYFFSVVDHPERPIKLFTFDTAKRSFAFPVVIEDEKTPQGRVTDKLITYKFDGKYFVKVG